MPTADTLVPVVVVQPLADLERAGGLTPTSLTLPPDIPFDQYEAVGRLLGRIDTAAKWWIGDWLLAGETLYGEAAAQASEALGIAEDTRQRYLYVASRVPPARRFPELSWTHHRHVAALDATDQEVWLERAAGHAWSARELYAQLRDEATLEAGRQAEGGGSETQVALSAVRSAVTSLLASSQYDASRSTWTISDQALQRFAFDLSLGNLSVGGDV